MDNSSSLPDPAGATGIIPLPPKSLIGFISAVLAVVIISILSYQSLQGTAATERSLAQSIEVLAQLESLLSSLKDAETGQRGYLLTEEEAYLAPYLEAQAALPVELERMGNLLAGRTEQLHRLETLDGFAKQKMAELESTVVEQRVGRHQAALAIVRTDRGKTYMDRIRSVVAEMELSERQQIVQRTRDANNAATLSLAITWGGSGLLLVLICGAAVVASRDYRARQAQSWIRAGQMGLSERMQGDQPLDRLSVNLLGYLVAYLDAQVGAMYVAEGGQYRRLAGVALPPGDDFTVRPGDGLLGQAIKDNRTMRVRDVPQGYLPIRSATGEGTPAELMIVPAAVDGVVYAVIEIGFFGKTRRQYRELLSRASESIGVAVRAAKDRQRLEELLQETQSQAEELQAGQEELRVSNEELEEQGRALRESQANLEHQQAELEQANSQLEEQTQLLEHQKDALAGAHGILTSRSAELQRANEYKSEFLANMSHELRTPLNSTLILAKLLADNKDGNLSEQQVKFAQTITSAGNDLLSLINDVLDLSRIEAGKVELSIESIAIAAVVDSLQKNFQPTADQKHIRFSTVLEPGVPERIDSDSKRLGQILKNLLSNAFKFTQQGEVGLRISAAQDGTLAFSVRDTGVGIAAHQHDVIFEAFRQADGSIHRKFGGTGLGLSISRDLAALLGGSISVQSEVGVGSVFTLVIPIVYRGANAALPARPRTPIAAAQPEPQSVDKTPPASMPDDRDQISPNGRTILVVEDDAAFAMILRDLVRELGFGCVVTGSANEGLIAAAKYEPSAILLDVNLPDHSGLGVLDQLKRNSRTRHIPVHVISVADYKREALELGAVGYVMKPALRGAFDRGAAALGSQVLAKCAAGTGGRGRSSAARKHTPIAVERRRADHRGGHRRRCVGASQRQHLRLYGGGF